MSIEPDLALYAGPRAYRHIQHNGLHAQDIGKLIGSAGGPKALALNGLDQYLFSEWLTSRSDPLWLFASSIAAWRFACAAQADPCAAFEQFAQLYIDCSLPAHACVDAITQATQGMLAALVGKEAARSAILNHPCYRLAITVARCKGWACSNDPKRVGLALGACLLGNYVHPAVPRLFFERVIVHDPRASVPIRDSHNDPVRYARLDHSNLLAALTATTAIPLAIQSVTAASHWPAGVYRDGGLVDYNFCTLELTGPGFVLFPHFSPGISASWFDKYLPRWQKSRRPHSLDDLILICPTPRFLERLQGRKIPDRSDYKHLSDPDRRHHWRQAVLQSQRLGEQFARWVDTDSFACTVRPLPFP